jgi:hypothetical protein
VLTLFFIHLFIASLKFSLSYGADIIFYSPFYWFFLTLAGSFSLKMPRLEEYRQRKILLLLVVSATSPIGPCFWGGPNVGSSSLLLKQLEKNICST